MSLERCDKTLKDLIDWAIKNKSKNGKLPSKSAFATMYNGRWVSLAELIEYARKRGIDV